MMLNFVKLDDLKSKLQSISIFIHSRDINLKTIGEERDGNILLRVNEFRSCLCTHILLYNREEKSLQVLHSFENEVDIVHASINQSHTVLAFVTKFLDLGDSCCQKFQYEAWIHGLELKGFPQCLDIKSPNEIRVNFRYLKNKARTSGKDDSVANVDELFTFTLTKSIDVYRVTKESQTELKISKHQTIVKEFLSAQWDAIEQCIYYSHSKLPIKLSDHDSEGSSRLMLTCLQFHDTIHYETVLNIPMELTVVSNEVNLDDKFEFSVLTLPSGVVCICQQQFHCYFDNRKNETITNLNYSIMLLHHGCTLHCSIPDIKGLEDSNHKILFSFCSENYVLAVLPGTFVHLLDVGLQHEPCNHVLSQSSGLITHTSQFIRYSVAGYPVIFTSENFKLFQISISAESLLHQLQTAQNLSSRIAMIHQLIVHFKIKEKMLEKLVHILAHESSCLERSVLFQEFLIGETRVMCENSFPRECLKVVPLTISKPKENQIEQGPTQIIQLTYSPLLHTSMTLLSLSQRLRPSENDVWINLWRYLLESQCQQPEAFFPHVLRDRLMVSMDYQDTSEEELEFSDEELRSEVLRNSLSNGSRMDDIIFPFPEKDDLSYSQFEQVLSTNLREMSMHISKHFRDKSPTILHMMAQDYISNQLAVSRLLCHHLLRCYDSDILHSQLKLEEFEFLNDLPIPFVKNVFHLMNQFYIAVMEIAYPLPKGFSTFLSLLGLKCLDFRMYLQYVNHGALQLHNNVVTFIMKNLDDTATNADFKRDILLRLPKNKLWKYLELWDHEYSREILSRRIEQTDPNWSVEFETSITESTWRASACRNFSTSPPILF